MISRLGLAISRVFHRICPDPLVIAILLTVLTFVLALIFGFDPTPLHQQQGGGGPAVEQGPMSAEDQERADFVKAVLGSTEDVWKEEFARMGTRYEEPRLVLFTGQVRSGCGFAGAVRSPPSPMNNTSTSCTASRPIKILWNRVNI